MNWNFADGDSEKSESLVLRSLSAYQKAVNTAAIVSITDKKGKIIFANDLFCEISKYSREELIGNTHRIINSGAHPDTFFTDLWKTIAAGKIWHGEIKNRSKDGSYYWVDTTISPIFDNKGQVLLYLSIRSLITDRKNLEQDRERLIIELTHKYNELMQFNYVVSHNLRAPIANMIGLVSLLKNECDGSPKTAQELVKFLANSSNSIDLIIRDLTEILSTRDPIHQKVEEVNLRDVVKSVENSLETQIKKSGTILKIDLSPAVQNFKSIKSYIQSIIYNLLSNAIKYSREGVDPVIELRAEKVRDRLIIVAEDNGIGMDLTKISTQLFGLYKKFNFSKEGRGLGLHMTKTQVESMGGDIEVKSHLGEGSTFTVTLPT